jgi:SAM-dependent methyltransferase
MASLKDFDKIYRDGGAYHVNAKGFDAWFLDENYSKIASFCTGADTILDLGCGEGRFSDYVSAACIDGIDYLQSALELNRKVYGPRYRRLVHAHLKDLGSLHLSRGSYDRIVCSLTLMYLSRAELLQCLRAAGDLLKDDGIFVATYPNQTALRVPSKESLELPAHELVLAFEEANFSTGELIPVCPFLPEEIVKQSYISNTSETAKAKYLVARSQMDMSNSYHFLITAQKH